MSELIAAALRMMAPAGETRGGEPYDGLAAVLPTAAPYAEFVRRFEPGGAAAALAIRAGAIQHLVRIHRTLATLNDLARERGPRAALPGSDHLYRAHGDPRD
jgi:hypothetical protein